MEDWGGFFNLCFEGNLWALEKEKDYFENEEDGDLLAFLRCLNCIYVWYEIDKE